MPRSLIGVGHLGAEIFCSEDLKRCAMKFLIRYSKLNLIWQKFRSLCGRSRRKDDDFSDNPYLIL